MSAHRNYPVILGMEPVRKFTCAYYDTKNKRAVAHIGWLKEGTEYRCGDEISVTDIDKFQTSIWFQTKESLDGFILALQNVSDQWEKSKRGT